MTFLQPWMLFALPLIALPVIIHLINQRRFRTIRWGAMMFLLAANRMSRGYARIRQWLILAARTLAIAGLIFAVSRPLASGWMSLAAGGRPDTTIVLLDRSPSMLEQGPGGKSKLDSARDQLVHSFNLLGSDRWVLIDSVSNTPTEFASPDELASLMQTQGVSASADLPAMLQAAYDYVRENRPSRTEIWIASDVRRNDWDPDGGRWQAIRDAFLELPQPVRFHLLAYPEATPENRSIRVTNVRRIETGSGAELLLSLKVEQPKTAEETVRIPVQLELDGAKSEIAVELTGSEVELQDYAVPLDGEQIRGWGRVSLPADANPADNDYFFVYGRPAARRALVVAEEGSSGRALELAAGIPPDPSIETTVETLTPEQAVAAEWEQVSLVLWQAELPQGEMAERVRAYVRRGGRIVFFPPESPTDSEFAGMRWGEWQDGREASSHNESGGIAVTGWVGDQDLLSNARSGAALPVGELRIAHYCELHGQRTALATLDGGAPLLCRTVLEKPDSQPRELRDEEPFESRHVYFCTTTASETDSSLARNGVVLYVMVQRALADGAAALGTTRQFVAGRIPGSSGKSSVEWERLSDEADILPTSYGVLSGGYRHGEKLFAVNRSPEEDRPAVVPDAAVAGLFGSLDFHRIDAAAGSGSTLLSEVWRMFLLAMMVALLIEAGLCLPKIVSRGQATRREATPSFPAAA